MKRWMTTLFAALATDVGCAAAIGAAVGAVVDIID